MKAKGFRTRSARDVFRKDAEELAAAVGEGEAQGLISAVYRWATDCAALSCNARGLNWEKVFRQKRGEPHDYLYGWAEAHAARIDEYPDYEEFYQEAQDAIDARISEYLAAKIGRPFCISAELAETAGGRRAAEDGIAKFISGRPGAFTPSEIQARNEQSRKEGAGQVAECYFSFSAGRFYVYGWLIDGAMTDITAVSEEEFTADSDADALGAE